MHWCVGITLHRWHPCWLCLLFLISHCLFYFFLQFADEVQKSVNFFEVLCHSMVLLYDTFCSHLASQTYDDFKFLICIEYLKSFLGPNFSWNVKMFCQKGTFWNCSLDQSHEKERSQGLLIRNNCLFKFLGSCVKTQVLVKKVIAVILNETLVFLRLYQLEFIFLLRLRFLFQLRDFISIHGKVHLQNRLHLTWCQFILLSQSCNCLLIQWNYLIHITTLLKSCGLVY